MYAHPPVFEVRWVFYSEKKLLKSCVQIVTTRTTDPPRDPHSCPIRGLRNQGKSTAVIECIEIAVRNGALIG